MADVARSSDPGVPSGNHDVVPTGTEDDVPRGDVDEEDSVLPALWSWVPRLVCLPAASGSRLCLAVCSLQIQDHHL